MSTQDPRYDQSTATSTHSSGTEMNQSSSATPQFKPNFDQQTLDKMQTTFTGFSLGRKIVIGSGVAAIIFFFLPWYKAYVESSLLGINESSSASGFGGLNFLSWLLLLAFTGAMALPLIGKSLNQFVSLPYSQGRLAIMGAGAVTAITLLFGLISKPSDDGFGLAGTGVEAGISFAWGFYLAVIALFAMCYGAWTMYKANE